MKTWVEAEIIDLAFSETANNGNNDTHTHKGWCEMHKQPEKGICTCGAGTGNPS